MSEPLSSDILERQFGPTRLEVLAQDGRTRVICTRTTRGQVLELSRVTFRGPAGAGLADVHREVLAGGSMGKAFRNHGTAFKRRSHAVYDYGLPDNAFRRRFGSDGKATVVRVTVLAGPDSVPYADILEVYAPAVDWPEASKAMDGETSRHLDEFASLLTSISD